MQDYAICEISKKQYQVIPDQPFEVAMLEGAKDIEVLVLLLSDNGKISLGTPYLKDKITLKVLENTKGDKIRVAKFHAKANYRRVIGYRSKKTRLVWSVKK